MQRKPNGLTFLVKGLILPSLHPMYQLYQRIMVKPDKNNLFAIHSLPVLYSKNVIPKSNIPANVMPTNLIISSFFMI